MIYSSLNCKQFLSLWATKPQTQPAISFAEAALSFTQQPLCSPRMSFRLAINSLIDVEGNKKRAAELHYLHSRAIWWPAPRTIILHLGYWKREKHNLGIINHAACGGSCVS